MNETRYFVEIVVKQRSNQIVEPRIERHYTIIISYNNAVPDFIPSTCFRNFNKTNMNSLMIDVIQQPWDNIKFFPI